MNRLKELRIQKGLNQSELGNLLGVQAAAISKYETNAVSLAEETIFRLCSIFNITSDYLLGLSDENIQPYHTTDILRDADTYGIFSDILQDIKFDINLHEHTVSAIENEYRKVSTSLSTLKSQIETIIWNLSISGVDEAIICKAIGVTPESIKIILFNKPVQL